MSKVYVVCKDISPTFLDDIAVTTSKKKAEKIALMFSSEYSEAEIISRDTTEYDGLIDALDAEIPKWNINVYNDGDCVITRGPYLCPSYKQIARDTYMTNSVISVNYVPAKTKEEAIKIAKDFVKNYLKTRNESWNKFLESEE